MEENFKSILNGLRQQRVNYPRTIIYCQSMEDCTNAYLFFQNNLGPNFTEPIGATSFSKYRLVELFTSCTDDSVNRDDSVKTQIIESFITRIYYKNIMS